MGIKLSDLPADLQRRILQETGLKPTAAPRRRSTNPTPKRLLWRVCSCLFEMFRPDGDYPDRCDGCGKPWATPSGEK